jgi:hypothetical protein
MLIFVHSLSIWWILSDILSVCLIFFLFVSHISKIMRPKNSQLVSQISW